MWVVVFRSLPNLIYENDMIQTSQPGSLGHIYQKIIQNFTRYEQSANISMPEGCIEPKDKAKGWPIIIIGDCNDTYLFKFNEQLARPKSQRNVTTTMPELVPSDHCKHTIMRCQIRDFSHPAHFILNFLPCWSTWWEYTHQNKTDTNTKLMLFGDTQMSVSNFAKDWIEVFDCIAEIDGKPFGKQEAREECDLLEQKYVDFSYEHFGGYGFPPGNSFHFDTSKGTEKAGMMTYFYHPDHAYALRLWAYSKLGKFNNSLLSIDTEREIQKKASPSFHVLFINRNNGKREIGGPDVANITNNIRTKLSNLGISSNNSRITETNDFGQWNGSGQIMMMSDHDIIISPHGNQWSSIGLAPECASVLEVYVSTSPLLIFEAGSPLKFCLDLSVIGVVLTCF